MGSLVLTSIIVLLVLSCAILLVYLLRIRSRRRYDEGQPPGGKGVGTSWRPKNANPSHPPPSTAIAQYPAWEAQSRPTELAWQARWEERERQIQGQAQSYENRMAAQDQQIRTLEAERSQLQAEKARLETLLEQQTKAQQHALTQEKLNWQELSQQQQKEQSAKLEQDLRPLQQQIQYFQQQLEQQHRDGIRNSAQLEQYLSILQEDTQRLSAEAQGLADALKGDQRRQGAWGEMILARTLEQSGLREGVEYQLQRSFQSADGQTFRPDAVIQFPAQRYIIIDAKVSLTAYEAYLAAKDEGEREQQLKKHCESLQRHIKNLGDKEYHRLLGVQRGPDFVLLFCPIEGALAEALRMQNKLFEEAFRRHIIVVSPTLLFVVLRIVEQLWRYEKQQRNTAEIFRQAGRIYDKLALFCSDMVHVEQQVQSLGRNVNQAMQRLSQGRQSLLRQVARLQELGAETSKEFPSELWESSPSIELNLLREEAVS